MTNYPGLVVIHPSDELGLACEGEAPAHWAPAVAEGVQRTSAVFADLSPAAVRPTRRRRQSPVAVRPATPPTPTPMPSSAPSSSPSPEPATAAAPPLDISERSLSVGEMLPELRRDRSVSELRRWQLHARRAVIAWSPGGRRPSSPWQGPPSPSHMRPEPPDPRRFRGRAGSPLRSASTSTSSLRSMHSFSQGQLRSASTSSSLLASNSSSLRSLHSFQGLRPPSRSSLRPRTPTVSETSTTATDVQGDAAMDATMVVDVVSLLPQRV